MTGQGRRSLVNEIWNVAEVRLLRSSSAFGDLDGRKKAKDVGLSSKAERKKREKEKEEERAKAKGEMGTYRRKDVGGSLMHLIGGSRSVF
jgi:hypothetical protein